MPILLHRHSAESIQDSMVIMRRCILLLLDKYSPSHNPDPISFLTQNKLPKPSDAVYIENII